MNKKQENVTNTADANKYTSIRSRRLLNSRIVQNFLLVWLDGNIDENNSDYQNTITKLREVINTVHRFTDVGEFVRFITDMKGKKAFIISSGALGQTVIPSVHDMAQVSTIYIFCGNKARHEQWTQQWPKIKGVFTEIKPICTALRKAVQECDQNTISMSFMTTNHDIKNQNLDQLDQSFMYTQILKEILITIDFESQHFIEFINYCRDQFDGNPAELKNVDKLEREYRLHTPIWWYTYHCFLYSMLNCALRTMEVDIIIKAGFFIRDLHRHIARLHSEQNHAASFVVYRGQGLSQTDFDQLMKTIGGLLSFNNFLSTSKNRQVSLKFAHDTMKTYDLLGILFVITIDPSIPSTPFASVRDVGYYQAEEEILFSMHSVFRIGQIKKLDKNDRLWQVDLIMTSDNDPQLHALTERIQEDTLPDQKGWYRLGELLIQLGQFDKAQQVYDALLDQTFDQGQIAYLYDRIGWIKYNRGEYIEAITCYKQAIEIYQTRCSNDHGLASCYSSMSTAYGRTGEYYEALLCNEKALEIYQKILFSNHPTLATCYNNIGFVYEEMGEYPKALSSHEKAFDIYQKVLPPNHPQLANSYNNLGKVWAKMRDYQKALSSHGKALQIYQKTLPPNHPDLAVCYACHGFVYSEMGEYSKALSFHERALDIGQRSLPENHPHLHIYKNHIENIKKKL